MKGCKITSQYLSVHLSTDNSPSVAEQVFMNFGTGRVVLKFINLFLFSMKSDICRGHFVLRPIRVSVRCECDCPNIYRSQILPKQKSQRKAEDTFYVRYTFCVLS